MTTYLAWWQGALALGILTVLCVFLIGRMLGVSGSWSNIVNWRAQREQRQTAAAFASNTAAMEDALLAATLAEFGGETAQQLLTAQGLAAPSAARPQTGISTSGIAWTAHLTFLLFMVIGGFLVAAATGHFHLRLGLGTTHMRLFGTGWHEWLTLLSGGVLVGFGTQMGGGCTSGHGLSGVSRLTPASLIATVTFFLTAVAASFLMESYLS